MSALRQAVEDYITLRRALGSKLERHPRLLESFADYLEAAGATTITIELALSWVRLPGDDANPTYLSNRLCAVRGFARHLQAFDPATEVPPARLLPWPKCRAAPYIYSEDDITALMRAARLLTPVLRAATYESLIGLLSVTGMRVGEGIRLDRDDVDFDEGVLTIWDSKFGKSREVPLHPATLDALRTYAQRATSCAPSRGRRASSSPQRAPGWSTTPSSPRFPAWPATPGSPHARSDAGPACMTYDIRSPAPCCSAGIEKASTSRHTCRCCPPTWATATLLPRTGTCRRSPSCWRWRPSGGTARRRQGHERARSDPGGVFR